MQELVRSPSAKVRKAIASRHNLTKELVDMLADETEEEVLVQLVIANSGQQYLTGAQLNRIVSTSAKLALLVARQIARFENVDKAAFYTLFAAHPAPEVRTAVSRNHDLPKELVHLLAGDAEHEVLVQLVNTDSGREYLTDEQLKRIISISAELAARVAAKLPDFENINKISFYTLLAEHEAPEVRLAVCWHSDLPKAILHKLCQDTDPEVALRANKNRGK
jgi:hypothetical protein